jgi:hypothetical protein
MEKVVDTIKIEKLEGGSFNVVQGDRYSDILGYDEMLGLVSALTIAKEPNCLSWMKTKEEHDATRPKLNSEPSEVEFEDILVPESIGIYRYNGYSQDNDGDTLLIGFNNNSQLLGYCNGRWNVSTGYEGDFDKVSCKLIPCNREDLRAGDTVFTSIANFMIEAEFERLSNYAKVLDSEKVIFIYEDFPSIGEWPSSINWYKVVPVCN